MLEFIAFIVWGAVCAAGGCAWAAHKLKGTRSWREALVTIFGGGPGNPTKPV